MAKFYGKIGYFMGTSETSPGVWTPDIIEKYHSGDVLRKVVSWRKSDDVNDSIEVNQTVSIVADLFAIQNVSNICYIEWMGTLWKVTSFEIQRPRIILTIGGIYNGPKV